MWYKTGFHWVVGAEDKCAFLSIQSLLFVIKVTVAVVGRVPQTWQHHAGKVTVTLIL